MSDDATTFKFTERDMDVIEVAVYGNVRRRVQVVPGFMSLATVCAVKRGYGSRDDDNTPECHELFKQ